MGWLPPVVVQAPCAHRSPAPHGGQPQSCTGMRNEERSQHPLSKPAAPWRAGYVVLAAVWEQARGLLLGSSWISFVAACSFHTCVWEWQHRLQPAKFVGVGFAPSKLFLGDKSQWSAVLLPAVDSCSPLEEKMAQGVENCSGWEKGWCHLQRGACSVPCPYWDMGKGRSMPAS